MDPPHMAEQRQDNQLEHTYSSSVRIREVALKTCQRQWTIGRSGERVRDILAGGTSWWWWWWRYIYIYIYSAIFSKCLGNCRSEIFVYRIYEGFRIILWECSMYSYYYICLSVLCFDLLTRPKMPFKVTHRKEVTHSNGSYERKSRGRKLAGEMGRGNKKSHYTLIDWRTGREWPLNCMTVISAW